VCYGVSVLLVTCLKNPLWKFKPVTSMYTLTYTYVYIHIHTYACVYSVFLCVVCMYVYVCVVSWYIFVCVSVSVFQGCMMRCILMMCVSYALCGYARAHAPGEGIFFVSLSR